MSSLANSSSRVAPEKFPAKWFLIALNIDFKLWGTFNSPLFNWPISSTLCPYCGMLGMSSKKILPFSSIFFRKTLSSPLNHTPRLEFENLKYSSS